MNRRAAPLFGSFAEQRHGIRQLREGGGGAVGDEEIGVIGGAQQEFDEGAIAAGGQRFDGGGAHHRAAVNRQVDGRFGRAGEQLAEPRDGPRPFGGRGAVK